MRDPFLRPLLAVSLLATLVVAVRQVDMMDPDGIAHLRVAENLLAGRFDLAVNGVWGPLFGVLLAALIGLGMGELVAVRVVLALGSIVLAVSTLRFLRAMRIEPGLVEPLALAGALWAAQFSGTYLNADLLLAAAAASLCADLVSAEPDSGPDPVGDLRIGLVAGLCYWCKPSGLPFAAGLLVGTGFVESVLGRRPGPSARAALARRLLAMGLVVAPVALALSLRYGRPTLAEAGGINRAILHPTVPRKFHPTFRILHQPRSGRITSWEDPTEMEYVHWSPFDSPELMAHQLELMRRSLVDLRVNLAMVDFAGIGFFSLVLVPGLALVSPQRRERWRWVWLWIPFGLQLLLYLPFHRWWRYDWPCWPAVLAALGLLAGQLVPQTAPRGGGAAATGKRLTAWTVRGLVLAAPGLAAALYLVGMLFSFDTPYMAYARTLAGAARDAGAVAPVAGWRPDPLAPPNGMGLYVAYLLRRPWLGFMPGPEGLGEAERMGAGLIVVEADEPPPEWLVMAPGWRVLAAVEAGDRLARLRKERYYTLLARTPSP